MTAEEILTGNLFGTLATANEDGSPWATPVHIFHSEGAVYWFSHDDTQHSRNVQRDGRVSVVVYTPNTAEGLQGVYVNGKATILGGSEAEVAKEIVVQRLGQLPKVFETAAAYRLPLGTVNGERSKRGCWYFYS